MTFHIEQRPGTDVLNKKHKLKSIKADKQKRTKKNYGLSLKGFLN